MRFRLQLFTASPQNFFFIFVGLPLSYARFFKDSFPVSVSGQ